jgi:hypothetical protein
MRTDSRRPGAGPATDDARCEHLLVVRVWRERTASQRDWRGFVDRAGSRERRYFGGLDQLMVRIAELLKPSGGTNE